MPASSHATSLTQVGLGPLEKGAHVLEVGSGTGNYTVELARKGLVLIGVEPSRSMLVIAKSKSNDITWLEGMAESIPLENELVDGVILMLTIHHWDDLLAGFKEVMRVLKPGGRVVLFTSLPEQTASYWLKHYFPVMTRDSAEFMPTEDSILNAIESAGLRLNKKEKYEVRPDLKDLFFYSGKHRPTLYLDPEIRKGISSFSLVAHKDEVDRGLQALSGDIESGAIEAIIESHNHDLGDYIFFIAEK